MMTRNAALRLLALLFVMFGGAAHAADADDEFLNKATMRDSVNATMTASVIAYPSVCKVELSDKMKAASVMMAAAHGARLMTAVRAKLMNPAIEAGREQWCSRIAKFIASVEPDLK